MFDLLWNLTVKIFVFIFLGVIINRAAGSKWDKITNIFIWAALYLLIPIFTFMSMWSNPVSILRAGKVVAIAFIVLGTGIFFALLWSIFKKIPFRMQCLPIIFMNSAYLAIPINTFLWGAEGTTYSLIYNIVVTITNFTLGIWMVSAEKPLREIAGMPVVYTAIAGAVLNIASVKVPIVLIELNKIISTITLPVMLLFVGYRIGNIKAGIFGSVFGGIFLRMAGGYISALTAVHLFRVTGSAAGVCIITSSMPAAVYSYILTERFKGDTEFAAASVFTGTLLTFFTVPVFYYLIDK